MSPLYIAVTLRADPPPVLELPPPQPAIAAAAIRTNSTPAYAYRLLRAAGFIARPKLSIASNAASQASTTIGVLRGRRSNPGGSEEMVAKKVAVHDAVVGGVALLFAPVEVHGAVPRLVLPLKNCTVPVGP